MIKLIDIPTEDTVGIRIGEKIEGEDYDQILPEVEKKIEENDQINMMVDVENPEGVTASAVWKDLKFDARHFNNFKKVAVVGDEKWLEWMSNIAEPFTSAEVKNFKGDQKATALRWLLSEN